ncbi:MAG: putative bifunctional diguanylate cyclase/phosphodiesterase [Ilumatobacteraceae bacterium]
MTSQETAGGPPPRGDDAAVSVESPIAAPGPAHAVDHAVDHDDQVRSHLQLLLAADEAATLVFGLDRELIHVNDIALAFLGASDARQLVGDTPASALLRNLLDHVPQHFLRDPAGGVWRGDLDIAVPGGPPQTAAVTVLVHHDPTAPNGGFIAAIARDVTDAVLETERLRHDLEHDRLTGLINRAALLRRLAAAIESARTRGGQIAVLVVDVDHLRDVNDALGHEIGDRLLTSTARRLASAVRPTDVVARFGGDEFVVFYTDVADSTVALDLADRARRALTGRLTIKQLELDVSVSIGVALSDPDLLGEPPAQAAIRLVSHADTAAHAAKRAGRARTALFNDQLRSRARERVELAAALSRALRHEELHLEYQPIFSAVSEQAEAVEALLRWDHPERGRIDANDFVRIAEETGVIMAIDDWVLRQACSDTRALIDNGVVGQRFAVHVNVSRLQLANSGFVNGVVELLREYRLRPRQLVLEARESTLIGDAVEVTRSVRALRRVGIRVALDNFGTGANSLSILTDIGADVLKLDGGLALPTGSSDADTRVVRALVLLAHALNMEVVAERVSGLEQLRRLRAAGCDLVQGNVLGRPCPADEIHLHMNA